MSDLVIFDWFKITDVNDEVKIDLFAVDDINDVVEDVEEVEKSIWLFAKHKCSISSYVNIGFEILTSLLSWTQSANRWSPKSWHRHT